MARTNSPIPQVVCRGTAVIAASMAMVHTEAAARLVLARGHNHANGPGIQFCPEWSGLSSFDELACASGRGWHEWLAIMADHRNCVLWRHAPVLSNVFSLWSGPGGLGRLGLPWH